MVNSRRWFNSVEHTELQKVCDVEELIDRSNSTLLTGHQVVGVVHLHFEMAFRRLNLQNSLKNLAQCMRSMTQDLAICHAAMARRNNLLCFRQNSKNARALSSFW